PLLSIDSNKTNTSQDVSGSYSIFQRILGKIPVEKDGSFHVRVPSEIPLSFHLLDSNGMSVGRQKSFTWVMYGENRGCIGCHEDRELSPPNRFIDAVKKPENKLSIDPKNPGMIDFVSHVFPVIEKKCFACHAAGKKAPSFGDPRKTFQALIRSENPAVIPFKPTQSPLMKTLFNLDPKNIHGLEKCSMNLTDTEKQILVDWVNTGAAYLIPKILSVSKFQE
ncbi:MAG: hypothetical protein JRI61_12770, partial [Deltaproteobacteria bacterium]|nr:hypothetical protein [Deltaproteobacteria bacterium]